jgi:hypothetical protein
MEGEVVIGVVVVAEGVAVVVSVVVVVVVVLEVELLRLAPSRRETGNHNCNLEVKDERVLEWTALYDAVTLRSDENNIYVPLECIVRNDGGR